MERARWLERVRRTTCSDCGATWEGLDSMLDDCHWCEQRRQRQREAARFHALRQPDFGDSDAREHEMTVFVLRLTDALNDGVITPDEAERALTLATRALASEAA